MINKRISPNRIGIYGLALLSITLGTLAMAASTPSNVELELVAELRVVQAGKGYVFVPATTVMEGQEIFYTLYIRNPSDKYLTTLSIDRALPANTQYVPGSATGAGAEILFSVDGGRNFAKPTELRDPEDPAHAASPDQYTHIRWRLRYPLAPGAVVLARFRAVFV